MCGMCCGIMAACGWRLVTGIPPVPPPIPPVPPPRRECSEINSSLMALKECIRYRALAAKDPDANVHVPYRGSTLTRVLKDSLDSPEAHTCVIATSSPSASDTEHTMCTFDTVSRLTGGENNVKENAEEVADMRPPPVELVHPQKWSAAEMQAQPTLHQLSLHPSLCPDEHRSSHSPPIPVIAPCAGVAHEAPS